TATIGGAGKLSSSTIQAGSLGSVEQLGAGAVTLVGETGHEGIKLGTGGQTVLGSSGDTITGGHVSGVRQVIDLTGTNGKVVSGPMTAVGGAGSLLVEAGAHDSIVGGAGPTTVRGGALVTPRNEHEDEDEGDEDHDDDRHGGGRSHDDGR